MHARLSCASLLIFVASITVAQQLHTGSSMSDREKAGLRGSVKEVVEQRTMSLPVTNRSRPPRNTRPMGGLSTSEPPTQMARSGGRVTLTTPMDDCLGR